MTDIPVSHVPATGLHDADQSSESRGERRRDRALRAKSAGLVAPGRSPHAMLGIDPHSRHGRGMLLNATLTPGEAMIEDLLFIRSALDRAGIDYLLVRGNDRRPLLAVDWRARKALRKALAKACLGEPFVSKADSSRGRPLLVSEGRLARDKTSTAFVLYRPRVSATGELRYGAKDGVRLELWEYGDEAIIAPAENTLMRHILPLSEARGATIERYGMTWPTIEGMFDTQATDIDFEIDIVFSWVDGTAIEWQRARARRMKSYIVGEGDDSEARFRQLDELKYAMRSVHLFAPWIRDIHIVTDSPVPEWLDDHPRVHVVRSEQFFADASVLPIHNSQAIESQLHNIPGLSEHFLYSNDDMFFGRFVEPSLFFSPGGVTSFIEATTRIGMGGATIERSGFENSARTNRELIRESFGRTITRHLEHAPTAHVKSVFRELEETYPEDFVRTAGSRFRSVSDISVTNSLYHYFALLTGRAVRQTGAKVRYVDTTMRSGLVSMAKLLARRNVDLFCLNDGSFPELTVEERAVAIRSFLEAYFPIPAPWEKPVAPEL